MKEAGLEKRTLLAVMAHPDDESFGTGGTLAKYAASGADVHVIIATDGDAGSVEAGHKRLSDRTLAQERQEELSKAAVALGLTSIWALPYRDSGMRGSKDNEHPKALVRQPIENLVAEITDYVRRLRPHVIITHDPYGGYGHPDHIRICEVVTAAFYQAGDHRYRSNGVPPYTPQKLYYSVIDKRIVRITVRLMQLAGNNPRQLGRNNDIDLVEISQWETPIHSRINVIDYLERKRAASEAHASQYSGSGGMLRMLPGPIRRRLIGIDSYIRAYPAPGDRVERDLFQGVRLA